MKAKTKIAAGGAGESWAFLCCVLCVTCFAPSVVAQETSLATFNPTPWAGLEKLTEAQAKSYQTAAQLAGDGDETEGLRACWELIKDPTVPDEVYRWAYLRQVDLHTMASRENVAMQIAQAWLEANPKDPVNLGLHCVMVQICAWRGSPNFDPSLAELEASAEPIFTNYPQTNVDVIDAHSVYAQGLVRFYINTGNLDLLERALAHAREALAVLDQCERQPALKEDARLDAAYLERKRNELDYGIKSIQEYIASAAAAARAEAERADDGATDYAWSKLLE